MIFPEFENIDVEMIGDHEESIIIIEHELNGVFI